jgi:two-component sensor histidine kinase
MVQPDGSTRWVHARGEITKDANGNVVAMHGTSQDITNIKRTQEELQASLREKEVLLKEVHHRVKNNLAMVSAFISLQKSRMQNESARAALETCESRIQAMAMVHKKLYQSENLSSISMQSLFTDLTEAMFTPEDRNRLKLDINAGDILLAMDVAIPCALIVNELMNNSLKHAFANSESGSISLAMRDEGRGIYRIVYEDSGSGLPTDIDISSCDSLGLQLVNIFAEQIKGSINLDQARRSRFEIEFKM